MWPDGGRGWRSAYPLRAVRVARRAAVPTRGVWRGASRVFCECAQLGGGVGGIWPLSVCGVYRNRCPSVSWDLFELCHIVKQQQTVRVQKLCRVVSSPRNPHSSFMFARTQIPREVSQRQGVPRTSKARSISDFKQCAAAFWDFGQQMRWGFRLGV